MCTVCSILGPDSKRARTLECITGGSVRCATEIRNFGGVVQLYMYKFSARCN